MTTFGLTRGTPAHVTVYPETTSTLRSLRQGRVSIIDHFYMRLISLNGVVQPYDLRAKCLESSRNTRHLPSAKKKRDVRWCPGFDLVIFRRLSGVLGSWGVTYPSHALLRPPTTGEIKKTKNALLRKFHGAPQYILLVCANLEPKSRT